MSKLKIGLLVAGALIVGIIIGASGGNSSTTGKVSSNNKEKVQQSTVKSEGNSNSETPSPNTTPKPTGKVEVKSQTKRMDIGYTEVVGEVINNTQSTVSSVKVTATFYDAGGKVIATGIVYAGDTTNTPLAIGATTPFNVSSYPDKINADSFKLDVTWR